MSDIVERLENMWMEQEPKLLWADMEAITEEAAEEIAHLRAEHKMAFEAVDDVVKANDILRAENEKLREAYDTDALTISYNLGYTCGKDMAKDEIERLRGLLREAHVKMVENDLWVNLRQRVAAALKEVGDE